MHYYYCTIFPLRLSTRYITSRCGPGSPSQSRSRSPPSPGPPPLSLPAIPSLPPPHCCWPPLSTVPHLACRTLPLRPARYKCLLNPPTRFSWAERTSPWRSLNPSQSRLQRQIPTMLPKPRCRCTDAHGQVSCCARFFFFNSRCPRLFLFSSLQLASPFPLPSRSPPASHDIPDPDTRQRRKHKRNVY